jgi:hypothetical protein
MTAPDDRADPEQDQQIAQIVDQWFPLTSEQLDRLSLLLHPGRGRDGAA